MPHRSSCAAAVLVACCWMVTGPGVVPLRAIIECEHQHQAHHQGHPGTPAAPDRGPCFCGEMSAALDSELPPALTALRLPAAPVMVVATIVPFPLPPALVPGFSPAPEPPPPNRIA